MGCHTLYKKLITDNQEKIIQKVKDAIVTSNYLWYEFTSLEDLFESDEEWVQEIADEIYENVYGLCKVNGIYGIYEEVDGYSIDELRIGNYLDIIIILVE